LTEYMHKSLEWLHRIREENYERTKDMDLKTVIMKSIENQGKQ